MTNPILAQGEYGYAIDLYKFKIGDGVSDWLTLPWWGSQGVTGIQGDQGDTGPFGPSGETGADGVQGITGNQGLTGEQGVLGDTGSVGITGTQGITGTKGITGTQGIKGVTGSDGITGSVGQQGITGLQGILGLTGFVGITGSVGQGMTGPQGFTGIKGVTGQTGFTGLGGITGLANWATSVTYDTPTTVPCLLWSLKDDALFASPTGLNNHWVQVSSSTVPGYTGVQGSTGVQGVTGINFQNISYIMPSVITLTNITTPTPVSGFVVTLAPNATYVTNVGMQIDYNTTTIVYSAWTGMAGVVANTLTSLSCTHEAITYSFSDFVTTFGATYQVVKGNYTWDNMQNGIMVNGPNAGQKQLLMWAQTAAKTITISAGGFITMTRIA